MNLKIETLASTFMAKDPLGLAGLIVYMPDLTPEEYERHFTEDIRKAILDEEMDQARIARLLR